MVKTASTMLSLGTTAPDFSLPNFNRAVNADRVSLNDFSGKPVLVMFICNHCPFVKHLTEGLAAFGNDYASGDLAIVAISSNDVATHPDDSPEKMSEEAASAGYSFAYLYDETQDIAQAYTAACTPDFFLFDAAHKLAYRGQFDESRPGNGVDVTGSDLRAACDAVLAGNEPNEDQRASLGCNIKWKAGKEPSYFTGVPVV